MRGLNGRNGQLLKEVDTTRVRLEKTPKTFLQSKGVLFGDIYQGIASRKTGMNRKSLKIEAPKGQTVDYFFVAKYECYNLPNNKK